MTKNDWVHIFIPAFFSNFTGKKKNADSNKANKAIVTESPSPPISNPGEVLTEEIATVNVIAREIENVTESAIESVIESAIVKGIEIETAI